MRLLPNYCITIFCDLSFNQAATMIGIGHDNANMISVGPVPPPPLPPPLPSQSTMVTFSVPGMSTNSCWSLPLNNLDIVFRLILCSCTALWFHFLADHFGTILHKYSYLFYYYFSTFTCMYYTHWFTSIFQTRMFFKEVHRCLNSIRLINYLFLKFHNYA